MATSSSKGQYYSEVLPVPNTNHEVSIFKIATSKKDNWYARIIRRDIRGGYYRRTLKTASVDIAMSKAVQLWVELRGHEKKGRRLNNRARFEPLVKEWLQNRIENGYSAKSTQIVEYQFKNHFIPYFRSFQLDEIDERAYIDYLNKYRLDPTKYKAMRKKPTARTLGTEQSNLRAFLRWCVTRGHRTTPVHMRNVEKNQLDMIWHHGKIHTNPVQRRDLVSTEVYDTYRRYLRHPKPVKNRSQEPLNAYMARRRMHFYLITLYNFVARAGSEVLNLRFRDLELVRGEEVQGSAYIKMTTHHGKKVKRPGYGSTDTLTYYSDFRYPELLSKWVHFLRTGDGFTSTMFGK